MCNEHSNLKCDENSIQTKTPRHKFPMANFVKLFNCFLRIKSPIKIKLRLNFNPKLNLKSILNKNRSRKNCLKRSGIATGTICGTGTAIQENNHFFPGNRSLAADRYRKNRTPIAGHHHCKKCSKPKQSRPIFL